MEAQQDLNKSLPLPAEKMPECWNRDDRMNSLFAQFRNRSVNPQDWDSKYNFWCGMISNWCKHRMRCSFSMTDLNKAFKRNGRTPACFSVVLEELHRSKEIVPMVDFLRESPSSWGNWVVHTLVKQPSAWIFSVLKSTIVAPFINPETKYVHLETVKDLGELILSTISKSEENTLKTLAEVLDRCAEKRNDLCLSDEDVKFALIWLRHNKKAAFQLDQRCDNRQTLIKLSSSGVKDLTEAEEGLYKLERQEELLIKKLELLELEKEAVIKNAKAYLASGMRQVAKTCLKKKKTIENSIAQRAVALQNIQGIIARLQDAHTDSEVLNCYKTGATILKQILGDDKLTENTVADTMDDLSEVLEDFGDIETVLSKTVDTYDSELEDELSELSAESKDLDKSVTLPKNTPVKSSLDLDINKLTSLRLEDIPPPSTHKPSVKSPVPSQEK